jgi:hypothetical protein
MWGDKVEGRSGTIAREERYDNRVRLHAMLLSPDRKVMMENIYVLSRMEGWEIFVILQN